MRALALFLAITSSAAQEERNLETDEALVLVQARAVWEKKAVPLKNALPVDAASAVPVKEPVPVDATFEHKLVDDKLVDNIWSALKADAEGKDMLAELEKHQLGEPTLRKVLGGLVHAFDTGLDEKDSIEHVLRTDGLDLHQIADVVLHSKMLGVIVKRKMGEQLFELLKADHESAAVLAELEKLKELPEATIFMLLTDVGKAYHSGVSINKDDVEQFLRTKGFDQKLIDAIVPHLQQLDMIAKRLLHHRQEADTTTASPLPPSDDKLEGKIWSAVHADVLGKTLLDELEKDKLIEPTIRKVVRYAVHDFGTGADDPPTKEGVETLLPIEGFDQSQMDRVVAHLRILDLIVKKLMGEQIFELLKADGKGAAMLAELEQHGLSEATIRKVLRNAGRKDNAGVDKAGIRKDDMEQFLHDEDLDQADIDFARSKLQELDVIAKKFIDGQAL